MPIPAYNGGTGVENNNTMTLTGGDVTLTLTGNSNLTLPAGAHTIPTASGGGASGTWPISITGGIDTTSQILTTKTGSATSITNASFLGKSTTPSLGLWDTSSGSYGNLVIQNGLYTEFYRAPYAGGAGDLWFRYSADFGQVDVIANSNPANTVGGSVNLYGGTVGNSSTAGNIFINGGNAGTSSFGGNVYIRGGTATSGQNGNIFIDQGFVNIASIAPSSLVWSDATSDLLAATLGSHLSLSVGGTLSTDATNANTASTIVARDASSYIYATGLNLSKAGGPIVSDYLTMSDTTQAANNKNWGVGVANTKFTFYTQNDAQSSSTNWLEVLRSGNNITSMTFPLGNVIVSSVTASTTPTTGALVVTGGVGVGGDIYSAENIVANVAGKTFKIKQGSNACAGTAAVLVGGTVTISTTAVLTGDIILLNCTATGGTQGIVRTSISNGVSFTITSSSALDTSTYSWVIIKAA